MNRIGHRRPSAPSLRPPRRRVSLRVEALEGRQMLSTTAGSSSVVVPAATVVAPSRSGSGVGGALSPANVDAAYSFTGQYTGVGETIAIVDAYHDPNIWSDLNTFDSTYGLPAASLTVYNEYQQVTSRNGVATGAAAPQTDPGWSLEIAMDVEWAHAAAPGAKLVLVEANSASTNDLIQALYTAGGVTNVVSMSWGGGEWYGQTAYDYNAAFFGHANVTYVAAAGDDAGASGAEWPATSPNVLGVGGTTLNLNAAGGYGGETAWSTTYSYSQGYSGSAGGASQVESVPSYQLAALGAGAGYTRLTPDVSSVGNPATGVSVYDSVPGSGSVGWMQVGGTSAGAPLWAGIIADADQARYAVRLPSLSTAQTLTLLYSKSEAGGGLLSSYSTLLHDVTSGSNAVAAATTGYDMVTGLGTPVVSNIIAAAVAFNQTAYARAVATASSAVAASAARPAVVASATTSTSAVVATVPAVVTPASTVLVVTGPALTPGASSTFATTSGTAPATATTVSLGSASALVAPVQPLARVSVDLPYAPDEQPAPATLRAARPTPAPGNDVPNAPGLFLDPESAPLPSDEAILLAVAWSEPVPWDEAIEAIWDGGDVPEVSGPLDPAGAIEESSAGVDPAFAAGAALAWWTASEFRLGRADHDVDRKRRGKTKGGAR